MGFPQIPIAASKQSKASITFSSIARQAQRLNTRPLKKLLLLKSWRKSSVGCLLSSKCQIQKSRNHFNSGIILLLAQYHSVVDIVVDEEFLGTHVSTAPAAYAVNRKQAA